MNAVAHSDLALLQLCFVNQALTQAHVRAGFYPLSSSALPSGSLP